MITFSGLFFEHAAHEAAKHLTDAQVDVGLTTAVVRGAGSLDDAVAAAKSAYPDVGVELAAVQAETVHVVEVSGSESPNSEGAIPEVTPSPAPEPAPAQKITLKFDSPDELEAAKRSLAGLVTFREPSVGYRKGRHELYVEGDPSEVSSALGG